MHAAYLADLDQQVREKKERERLEQDEDLRRERSMVRRNNDDWHGGMFANRGGGGEPLRDADGRMCAGVRGLFVNRELVNGDAAASPVRQSAAAGPGGAAGQGSGQGSYSRPGSASSSRSSRSSGRASSGRRGGGVRPGHGAVRDPNAGQGVFGAGGEDGPSARRRSRAGLVAPHEVSLVTPPAPAQQQQQWPRPRSGGGGGGGPEAGRWQEAARDPHPHYGHQEQLSPPPLPQSSSDRVEVSAEWLQQIILERDRLRRQLSEAGIPHCC